MLWEWARFLDSCGCYEVPQPTFTFRRNGKRRDGTGFFLRETIDFAAVSFDPLDFEGFKWTSVCREDVPYKWASDHLPVEIRILKRARAGPRGSSSALGRRTKQIPEWVFQDAAFNEFYLGQVIEWAARREVGLLGLKQFARMVRTWAEEWLQTYHVQAVDPEHKLDITLALLSEARQGQGIVTFHTYNKAVKRYPGLTEVVPCIVSVVLGQEGIVAPVEQIKHHARTLSDEIVVQHDVAARGEGTSAEDDSIINGSLQTWQASEISVKAIKSLISTHKHSITILWDEELGEYVDSPDQIASVILREGLRRRENLADWQGEPTKFWHPPN